MKQEKKTELLNQEMQDIKTNEALDRFIEDNIVQQYSSFHEYFNEYIGAHDLALPEILKLSNIDKGYFYNIVNGRRQPKRDKILCLCIASGMDVRHTNRALRIGGVSELYPKNERDVRIQFVLNNGVTRSVPEVNMMLHDAGLDILE